MGSGLSGINRTTGQFNVSRSAKCAINGTKANEPYELLQDPLNAKVMIRASKTVGSSPASSCHCLPSVLGGKQCKLDVKEFTYFRQLMLRRSLARVRRQC